MGSGSLQTNSKLKQPLYIIYILTNHMNKKIFTIAIALLMVAVVTATAVYFLFPYEPKQPPIADDVGST